LKGTSYPEIFDLRLLVIVNRNLCITTCQSLALAYTYEVAWPHFALPLVLFISLEKAWTSSLMLAGLFLT